MSESPSQHSSLSGMRTAFAFQSAIAWIAASSTGPSKMPRPCTHMNSPPDRLTPSSRRVVPSASTSWFPDTCSAGAVALTGGSVGAGSVGVGSEEVGSVEVGSVGVRSVGVGSVDVGDESAFTSHVAPLSAYDVGAVGTAVPPRTEVARKPALTPVPECSTGQAGTAPCAVTTGTVMNPTSASAPAAAKSTERGGCRMSDSLQLGHALTDVSTDGTAPTGAHEASAK